MSAKLSPQKEIVRRFYEEMWNRADPSIIPQLFHPDLTFRGSLGPEHRGYDGLTGYVERVCGALEGYTCRIVELVEEGDKVVARLDFFGTHRGVFMGFAPTGERVSWVGSAHFAFRDGTIADLWVLGDVHGLIRQLQAHAGKRRS